MADLATLNATKLHFAEGSAPATPDAGEVVVYAKADGKLYAKDDVGAEFGPFGAGITDQGDFTFLDATEAAAPATPAAGTVRVYAKADGRIYSKDDAGVEFGPFDAAGVGGGSGIPSSQIKVGANNAISSLTLDIEPADGSFVVVGLTLATGSGGAALSSTNTTWTKVRSAALSTVDNELWVGAVGTAGGKVITITHAYSFCSGTAIEAGSPMDPASLGVGLSSATITNTLASVTAGNVVLIMCCNSNTTLGTTVSALDPRGIGHYVGIVTLMAVTADDTDVAITASGGNVLLMQELNLP